MTPPCGRFQRVEVDALTALGTDQLRYSELQGAFALSNGFRRITTLLARATFCGNTPRASRMIGVPENLESMPDEALERELLAATAENVPAAAADAAEALRLVNAPRGPDDPLTEFHPTGVPSILADSGWDGQGGRDVPDR